MSQTVLITGSSSGIGEATARRFLQEGWNVAATMRRPGEAPKWMWSEGIVPLRLDVTEEDTIRDAFDECRDRFGGLEAVVNNAGYPLVGPFEETPPEKIRRQFDTNVFGLMAVTRQAVPIFREQRDGVIVQVASMGGRLTFPLYSAYHATKWAVEGFSESLQYELRPFGIRVRIVEPGPIKTDFYERSMDRVGRGENDDPYREFVERAMPTMQEAGEEGAPPEKVAETIVRAATDSGWKMRYPVNAAPILALRRLLPDRLFQAVVRKVVLD
ncbi:MAG: SDR family oxidoreductase [Thermoanaerobaculia bacterium]|nr:SDR family oxidoreductase [Thermoanaerobaculia bacterium]